MSFLQQKIWQPLKTLLTQGTSPEKIAQCLVLGSLVSIFPILGTTTISLTVIALWLRLNLPAIQAVNWLFGGVQIALIIPFMRLGEWLFRDSHMPLKPSELVEMFRADALGFFGDFWQSMLHAITGWLVVCLPLGILVYFILLLLIRRRMVDIKQ